MKKNLRKVHCFSLRVYVAAGSEAYSRADSTHAVYQSDPSGPNPGSCGRDFGVGKSYSFYKVLFGAGNEGMGLENTYFWG
jgi:hypothetical protein